MRLGVKEVDDRTEGARGSGNARGAQRYKSVENQGTRRSQSRNGRDIDGQSGRRRTVA